MRPKDILDSITGVAPGAPALNELTVNRRYFSLDYTATANSSAAGNPAITNAADIVDRIETYVTNGGSTQLIRNVTADFLIRRYQFANNRTVPANIIPMEFAETERVEQVDEEILAWEMFGVSGFRNRLYFKSGILNPTLSGACAFDGIPSTITSGPQAGKSLRRIMRQDPYAWQASGGVYNITDIKPNGNTFHRIFFDGFDITKVEVFADGVKVFDRTKKQNDFDLSKYELDGTQFKFAVVFDEHGQVFNALTVARDIVVKVYSDTGGALSAVVETLSPDYR